MHWTTAEIETCISLIKSGLTYNEIGDVVNRSPKSVKEKLNDLNYKHSDYIVKTQPHCLNCNEPITNNGIKFCSQSCSAIYNNKLRKEDRVCLNCGKSIIGSGHKYCDHKCQWEYKQNETIKEIENGTYVAGDPTILKRYLIKKHGDKCMECGWDKINIHSNKIPIELHHIDGNPDNNSLENLILLCPNCHALTKNWKAITTGEGRHSKRRNKRKEKYDKYFNSGASNQD